jgi:hypothetical protein
MSARGFDRSCAFSHQTLTQAFDGPVISMGANQPPVGQLRRWKLTSAKRKGEGGCYHFATQLVGTG